MALSACTGLGRYEVFALSTQFGINVAVKEQLDGEALSFPPSPREGNRRDGRTSSSIWKPPFY
jgi:hypothetical protein